MRQTFCTNRSFIFSGVNAIPFSSEPGRMRVSSKSLTTSVFSCSVCALLNMTESRASAADSTLTPSVRDRVLAAAEERRYRERNKSSQTVESARYNSRAKSALLSSSRFPAQKQNQDCTPNKSDMASFIRDSGVAHCERENFNENYSSSAQRSGGYVLHTAMWSVRSPPPLRCVNPSGLAGGGGIPQ